MTAPRAAIACKSPDGRPPVPAEATAATRAPSRGYRPTMGEAIEVVVRTATDDDAADRRRTSEVAVVV